MRILKVTQAYYPFLDKGGPAIKVRSIAERLVRRGHQVTVLTASYGSPQVPETKRIGGVEVLYLRSLASYRSTTLNPGVIPFCKNRLREFDVVHVYGLYDLLGPTVAFLCRRRAIPYVVEPLGMVQRIDRSFRLKRLWHTILGSGCLRHASLLIATSRQEHGELVADGFPKDRVVVRYNGLDLEEFGTLPPRGAFRSKWGIPPDEPVILFLGRLIPRKGADLLISAFAEACPERGRLVIAGPEGEPGYLRSLREKTKLHGVEARVLFTGPLFGEQKKAAMVDSDVFALASRYENFANAAAESIACGTPVIVTDRCGISEFVRQQVGLVIPRDEEAFAQAMRRLLNDRPLYDRFKATCGHVAAKLGWDHLIEQMENLYAEVRTRNDGVRRAKHVLRPASL